MTTRRGGQRRQTTVAVEAAQPGAAGPLLAGNDETGVAHPERREHAPGQHLAQRLAFEARDQEPEKVGRAAVVETSPGLIDQRQRREALDPLVRRERVVDLLAECLGARATDRAAMKLAVGQPRSMRQQIPEGDRSYRLVSGVERSL